MRGIRPAVAMAIVLLHAEGEASLAAAMPAPEEAAQPPPVTQPAASREPETPESRPGEQPGPQAATTQPSSPSTPPRPPIKSLLQFNELAFDLGFDAEWQHRVSESRTRTPIYREYQQTDDLRGFEETIGLRGDGNLVDERLLHYSFNTRWGQSQEAYEESRPGPDLSDHPHGDLLLYDVRMNLFPAGKVSANFFALNQDDRIPRPFLPSLQHTGERYGAEVLYNDRVLPMRLSFESSYDELTSVGRSYLDDEISGEDALRYEATWQPSEYHQLRLNYEYDDRSEQYSGTRTEYDTFGNYVTLDHVLQFGEDHRNRLETLARYQDETGDLARDIYEFVPQLRLQHTDRLASTYRFEYLQESFQGIQQHLYRGDAGLSYQISEALLGSMDLYGMRQQADEGGDSNEWGGVGNLSFGRDNALGRLTANLNYTHVHSRIDDDGRDSIVINESATFVDPLPVILAHLDVDRPSVLVTDVTRTRVYLPGRDYVIAQVGRYTSLRRVPTGNIVNGQTVAVSYAYATSQGLELNRDRIDLRVQQAFRNGFTPYYAGSIQNEDFDRTRFVSYEPINVNRQRIGLSYQQRRGAANVEYDYNDDSIDPYQAMHLRGSLILLQTAPHALDTRGDFSYFHFFGSGDLQPHYTTLVDLAMSYRYALTYDLEASSTAAYRFEQDSLYGRTNGVDLGAAINWKIGLFTASLEVEYDLLDLPGSTDGTFAAWIKLRRDIPVIGTAAQ